MSNIEATLRSLAEAFEAGLSPRTLLDDPTLANALDSRVRTALRKSASASASTSLGDALRREEALDDGPAAIVTAAERGGFLPRGLRLAADCVRATQQRRRRAFFSLAYPAFLVVIAGVVLPLPLIFTQGVAAYVKAGAPFVVSIAALLVFAFVVWPRLPGSVRAIGDSIVARIPFVGTVVVEDARAACFEMLGALVAAGAPITLALPAAVRAAGRPAAAVQRCEQVIANGGTLAEALRAADLVDDARAGHVSIAERSGALDKTLPKLAEDARDRGKRRFAALVVVIGLVCFGAVAVGVGKAVVSGFQGYVDTIDRATIE